jgi:hypothetical protein
VRLPGQRLSIDRISIPDQVSGHLFGPARFQQLPCQAAVGCPVALKCKIRRRSWLKTISTNSTLNVAVGTVKKSSAMVSLA